MTNRFAVFVVSVGLVAATAAPLIKPIRVWLPGFAPDRADLVKLNDKRDSPVVGVAPSAPPPSVAPNAVLKWIGRAVVLGLLALAVFAAYRMTCDTASRDSPEAVRAAKFRTLFYCLLAGVLTDLHYSNVDLVKYFHRYAENVEWQRDLHAAVLDLEPEALPHSYRFLPNCLVAWLRLATGSFLAACLVYRWAFMLLLLAAIDRYARRFGSPQVALLAVALYAVVYPISLRHYAGQLADPMSHLSFCLAFFYLETRSFRPFAAAVLVGLLAKETVILMALFALLRGSSAFGFASGGALLALAAAELLLVRIGVSGGVAYEKMSGVGFDHLRTNLAGVWDWSRQAFHTFGIFLPFWFASLRRTPPSLNALIAFLLPTLLLSSLMFSFLKESRNYMPLVIPLAVVMAAFLTGERLKRRELEDGKGSAV